jgi:hypothetical protein
VKKKPAFEAKNRSPKKQGQILVLMALLSTTLVILFGFVVAMGHLVQAKINLQNAVDLAAMSGASWQARYLNHIALVNYRMRQNYKFVLYDIYITQSRFNTGLRNQVANPITDTLERVPSNTQIFGICQQAQGYAPVQGVDAPGRATGNSNTCNLVQGAGLTIPRIQAAPIVSPDPSIIAANIAIGALGQSIQDFCNEASGQNSRYFNWITQHFQNRQAFQVRQLLRVLSEFDSSFGVDSELDNSRTADQTMSKTFFDNLISANKQGVKISYLNPSKTRAFRNDGPNPEALANSIFGVAPPAGSFNDYFERQRVLFSAIAIDFQNCSARANRSTVAPPGTLLGISRSRVSSNTDAVRIPLNIVLKAEVTPNLLFWPQNLTPKLVAVGAAKPFGSRIGPPSELVNFELTGVRRSGENLSPSEANMSFYPGDAGPGPTIPGIGHKIILQSLLSRFPRGANAGANFVRPSIDNPSGPIDCRTSNPPFICLSLAPTLYEGLFWNVYPFPDVYAEDPSIVSEFPFDVTLGVADPNLYFMRDRMVSTTPSTSELEKWHTTITIGDSPIFRRGGKPAFFADTISVASSWSPGYEYDASDLNPQGLNANQNFEGRRGYQIKLVSLSQVCDEIRSGILQPGPALSPYCTNNNALRVFH